MKKIAFALQVFTLMTILPLYVIVEMNHSTVSAAENKIAAAIDRSPKATPADHSATKDDKMKI